jgi:DNA-directed RNA polymerase specialized sigma24 family protein
MLEELCKNDKLWRKIALEICRDTALADDLVQDMYIYFSDKKIKVNTFYVKRKIYGLFIDYIRKQKDNISVENLFYLKDNDEPFEPTDEEYEILLRYNNLEYFEKELIAEHYINEKSLRDIQKDFPLINYGFAFRTIKEGKNKIKINERIKKAND